MSEESAFPHTGFHTGTQPGEKLSADRRRTLRQRAQVAAGIHPLTGGRARPDLGTCGGCAHRLLLGWHDRAWPKCVARDGLYVTHGAASDVRRWWPACDRFEPGDRISPDAARWTPQHAAVPPG